MGYQLVDIRNDFIISFIGKFLGDVDVMAKVKFALTDHIALNLCIRSNNEEVKKLVIKSVL